VPEDHLKGAKKHMRCLAVLVLLSLCYVNDAYGQLNRLNDTSTFSSAAVPLNFDIKLVDADARNLYFQWGILFSSQDNAVPRVKVRYLSLPGGGAPPSPVGVLRTESAPGSSLNRPLTIDFRSPARRIAFWLHNGNGTNGAVLRAYDSSANLLGNIAVDRIPSGIAPPLLVGLESVMSAGIAKLMIDYGEAANGEEIVNLLVDFVSSPQFVSHIAQLADGLLTTATTVETIVSISNPAGIASQVLLEFFDDNGIPLVLETDQGTGSSVTR
jgi:hypothetical protein